MSRFNLTLNNVCYNYILAGLYVKFVSEVCNLEESDFWWYPWIIKIKCYFQ